MTDLSSKIQDTNTARKAGTELAPKTKTVFEAIRELQPQFALALGDTIDPARFVRVAVTVLRSNRQLAQCDQTSLLGALMICAQLGLEPGVGQLAQAYLVPYKNQVTFIVGYRGLMDLARRTGQIEDIRAKAVIDGDVFTWEEGLHPDITHKPIASDRDNPDRITHVYAVANLTNGRESFEVLSRAEVEKYRSRSAAKNSGPWVTDYKAMALKTAIRRLATWLPMDLGLARAVNADEQTAERIHVDIDDLIDLDPEPDDQPETPAPEPAKTKGASDA